MNYEEKLRRLTEEIPEIVVLTAENRGPMRGLSASLGDRFVDFGIAEQTMVGAAAGLALRGRIPVVHAFSTFLTMRAFEFIRTDVGIAGLPVKLFGAMSGFLSEANGPTHQALEDLAIMNAIPGVNIVCPADVDELVDALPIIIRSHGPAYIRYFSGPAAAPHKEPFDLGKGETLREGSDVAILAFGFLLGEAVKACTILGQKGVSARLINLRSLRPLDEALVLKAAVETGMLVTIEDHFLNGGLYSMVCETLVRRQVSCRVMPIALENRWFKPALLNDVLQHEGFSADRLAARIAEMLGGTR
jgi:transketolase